MRHAIVSTCLLAASIVGCGDQADSDVGSSAQGASAGTTTGSAPGPGGAGQGGAGHGGASEGGAGGSGTAGSGGAAAIDGCPNQPPGWTVVNEHAFDAFTADGWWDVYPDADGSIIEDPTAPISPPLVLQQRHQPKSTGGHWTGTDFSMRKEAYVCFWWKPSEPFYGFDNNTQKIVSFNPDCNMFLMWFGAREEPRHLGALLQSGTEQNIVHHASCPGPTSCNLYGNGADAIVTGGAWHRIEWYVKASDTTTSQNGEMRWWVDGKLAGSYTDINNCGGSYGNFQINHTWDSNSWESPVTDYHWFDHVIVAGP
jgi:hypothetical protein